MKIFLDCCVLTCRPPLVRGVVLIVCVLSFSACAVQRRENLTPVQVVPVLQNATLDELLAEAKAYEDAFQTMQATVELQPSVSIAEKSEIIHYRDVRAFLLIRKPTFLRMIGQYPVLRGTAFDLAADGQKFLLHVPSKNRLITGENEGGGRSKSARENLRPQHILDVLLWRGPDPEREQAVLEVVNEGLRSYYVVLVLRSGSGTKQGLSRKLWFDRENLSMTRLQIFEEGGVLATDARYSSYADFQGNEFPSRVVINRPLDNYGLILTITKLEFDLQLDDEKFQMSPPPGAEIVRLGEEPSS
jgi:hypothetical protein